MASDERILQGTFPKAALQSVILMPPSRNHDRLTQLVGGMASKPEIIESSNKLKDSAVRIKGSAVQMQRSTARVEDSADRRTGNEKRYLYARVLYCPDQLPRPLAMWQLAKG